MKALPVRPPTDLEWAVLADLDRGRYPWERNLPPQVITAALRRLEALGLVASNAWRLTRAGREVLRGRVTAQGHRGR